MLLDRRVRREVVPKARSTGRGGNRGGERGQESWVDSLPLRQTDFLCPGTFFLLITEDDMRRCGYLRIKSPPSPEVQGPLKAITCSPVQSSSLDIEPF